MNIIARISGAILFVAALASCAETPEAAFEKDLEAYRDSIGNVGMSVVVVKDNEIVYTHSFGVSDMEKGTPMTDDNLYRIASISKSFTATSLMQLVEQGKLSLSDDASTMAGFPLRNPAFPDSIITVEMMMSHTSSINDSQGYFDFEGINPETSDVWEKCYNDYAPGAGYEYCNLNFNLLGSFLEKLSGERFDQYVVNHVLKPLGLYGGYCVDSLDASRFARLYAWEGESFVDNTEEAYERRSERIRNYVPGKETAVFSPTGGMKITATDLARYMLMHMNYGTAPDGTRIISEESSRNMQTPRSKDENYGLALWHQDFDGVELVGHTGGAYGLRSAMFFNPEEKYGFVMVSNGSRQNESIIPGVLNRMYRHFIQK